MSANPLADLLGDAVEETKSQKYPSAANEVLPRAAAKPLETIALEFDSISAAVGAAPVAGSDAPLGGLQLFGGGAAQGGGGDKLSLRSIRLLQTQKRTIQSITMPVKVKFILTIHYFHRPFLRFDHKCISVII